MRQSSNGGCAGLILNIVGTLVISVIVNFLSQNLLLTLVGYAGYYGSAQSAFFMASALLVPPLLVMGCVQWSLRKSNYLATILFLLVPVVIGATFSMLHVGIFYSVLILIWSIFTSKRED